MREQSRIYGPHVQTVAFQDPSVLEEVATTLVTCSTCMALSQIYNLNLCFLFFLFRQLMWISG